MPLPLILAGPILRRVEPRLVSVWIALSEPLHVQVTLWEGLVNDDGIGLISEDGEELFHSAQPMLLPAGNQPAVDTAKTIRIGDHLHVAVVSLKLSDIDALLPNRAYSYNVTLRAEPNSIPKADLKTLKLLGKDPVDDKPNQPLGYQPGFLPSFELPPVELTDLRVLHGSCRRINRLMEDGLAWVDDLIRDARLGVQDPLEPAKPLKRPHQLLLSGDQIYADDVPLPLLPQLIARGRELLGNNEFLPTLWPNNPNNPKATFWPADKEHFPPGLRHQLINTEARFTTSDTHSHLISFGEFAAMYLFIYSNTLWDLNALTRFDDVIAAISDVPETWGAIFKRSKEDKEDEIDDELLKRSLELLFKTLPKDKLRKALKPRDESDTDESEQKRKRLDPKNLTHEKLNAMSADEQNQFREIYEFAIALPAAKLRTFRVFFTDLQRDLGGLYDKKKSKRREEVVQFFNGLAKVRRALANVPTYMIFDDHDVTDDWNLNPIWRNRVYTSSLGSTLVRNGLVAYTIFQGWGNDPAKFESGKYAELLQHITELFPTGLNTAPEKESDAAKAINKLIGLDDNPNPPIKWHYKYRGPKHLLLVMDNRTRRSFVSDIGPPGNVSTAQPAANDQVSALEEQIPGDPLPAEIEVVFVIASLPVIGPPLFDEVIAPLSYRVYDLISYVKHGNEELRSMPGTNPDAIEAWAFDPKTFEALLKRLEPFRRVVLLSGDVHYGSGQFLSYWKKNDLEPARIAQFNSSGLRNIMPNFIQFAERSFPLAQRIIRAKIGIARLGWDKNSPPPVTLPADNENVMPVLRAKLQESPVMIPSTGWPEGTSQARPPDWAWRAHVLIDERADAKRPRPSQPAPLPAGTDPTTLDGYRQIAARHVKQFKKKKHGRQIMFSNNLGLIKFEVTQTSEGKTLDVIQALYATHPEAENPTLPEIYTLHRVTLAAFAGSKIQEPKPTIGDQN